MDLRDQAFSHGAGPRWASWLSGMDSHILRGHLQGLAPGQRAQKLQETINTIFSSTDRWVWTQSINTLLMLVETYDGVGDDSQLEKISQQLMRVHSAIILESDIIAFVQYCEDILSDIRLLFTRNPALAELGITIPERSLAIVTVMRDRADHAIANDE